MKFTSIKLVNPHNMWLKIAVGGFALLALALLFSPRSSRSEAQHRQVSDKMTVDIEQPIASSVADIQIADNISLPQESEPIYQLYDEPENDIVAYGKLCAAAITAIPEFNCLDGEIVPITINGGVTPTTYTKDMDCDRPALLPYTEAWSDGQCIPYTRVLNLSEGPNQISVMCRQKKIRSRTSPRFDEIDIIAHNTVDGSTCWFSSKDAGGKGRKATNVPPPTSTLAAGFWQAPSEIAAENCVHCHDNDPFMYSPYIGQVWNLLPSNPQGWYKNIGPAFTNWNDLYALSTPDNPCLGCHRLGTTFTSEQGTKESVGSHPMPNANAWAKRYPNSHWMPPGNFHSEAQWNIIYQDAVQAILACHDDPSLPNCILQPITGLPFSE